MRQNTIRVAGGNHEPLVRDLAVRAELEVLEVRFDGTSTIARLGGEDSAFSAFREHMSGAFPSPASR